VSNEKKKPDKAGGFTFDVTSSWIAHTGIPSPPDATSIAFEMPSPEVIAEARSRGVKVVQRFDIELAGGQNPFDVWETMFGPEPDGEIQIWRKLPKPRIGRSGKPVTVEAVVSDTMAGLRQWLPQVRDFILRDSYFTVNLFYPGATHWRHRETGAPVMRRTENCLQNLVGVYVDMDVGRSEEEASKPEQRMTWRQAAAIAGDYMDAGLLPQATFFARSGRGVYCVWCLRDDQNKNQLIKLPPPPPYGEGSEKRAHLIGLYKRINMEFSERLRIAAADPIHDASRYLRLPGSIHSKANQPVIWQVQFVDGEIPTYTIWELANFAGLYPLDTLAAGSGERLLLPVPVEEKPVGKRGRETKKPGSAPNRIAGRRGLGKLRVEDILTIEGYQFGFGQGFREGCLLRYADALRTSGCSPYQVETKLTEMARRCRPGYPSDDNDASIPELVKEAFKRKRSWKTETLVKWFQVTPELARELGLVTIIPKEVREERRLTPEKRRDIIEKRRKLIADLIIENSYKLPPLRQLVGMCARYGFATNRETMRQDLQALGHKTRKPGRPKSKTSLFDT
jgi:hypothetical protein